jgi:ABC-2 type transport system permease protein
MTNLTQAIRVEALKAQRSRVPLFTALGFSLAPLFGGFFMVILKDPEAARRIGIISAKAQMVAGAADWPTYLGLLAQAAAIGGLILFCFIASWVFGREFADRTVKDLLALPTSRTVIVLAKFFVMAAWALVLTIFVYALGLLVGAAIGLGPASAALMQQGTARIAFVAIMTITLVTPIAFVACAGHGYLPAMGVAILLVILAQIVAAAGWGEYFPWAAPALYAGAAGEASAQLNMISYVLIVVAGLSGIIGTVLWWNYADQTR